MTCAYYFCSNQPLLAEERLEIKRICKEQCNNFQRFIFQTLYRIAPGSAFLRKHICWARSDKEKAELFAAHLSKVFTPN
jgi:hypothetical protein